MAGEKVRVVLGVDHGGFKAKEQIRRWLEERGIEFRDLGTYSPEPVDYPVVAERVAQEVAAAKAANTLGILACGTGIGMSMAANKVKGVRAAVCHDEFTAQMAREHNDANVLCVGGRILLTGGEALKIVEKFLSTEFSAEERHGRRVKMIGALEGRKGKAKAGAASRKKSARK